MNTQQISGPIGIAIAAVALIIVLGIGFWYMNRTSSVGGSVEDRTAAMNAQLKAAGNQKH